MKNAKNERISLQMFWQAGVIVLLAVIIGVLVNEIRSDRLPLVADWSKETQLTFESGGRLVISLDEAQKKFFSGEAVFIDARAPEFYKEGHIKEARNLPWETMDEYFDNAMANTPQDTLIIIYCDGESCELSKYLAQELILRGYKNVRVLINGWSLWKEHRFPIGN